MPVPENTRQIHADPTLILTALPHRRLLMRIYRLFAPVAIAVLGWAWTPLLHAQGLEDARARWPVFSSDAVGQKAELYVYYPSADFMVKLETTATPGLFSDVEFGYLVGDISSDLSELLAASWYQGQDVATITSAAQRLDDEAKTMRQPFQQPAATVVVAMDTVGLAFTYSGRAATGVGEVSWSIGATWAEIAAQQ